MTDDITPNVVVTDPAVRRRWGVVLYVLLFLAGLGSLFIATFPEVTMGTDIPTRAIAFVTTAVTWAGSAFGFSVTLPNVPRR